MNTENNSPLLKEWPQYKALWSVILSHRKIAYRIVGTVTIAMLIFVLIMPQSFTSTTTLLPPQNEEDNMGLASLLSGGGMPIMDITSSFGFGSRPADLYVQVLQSRTVAESLIVREHLDEFFDIGDDMHYRHAIEPLQAASVFEASKDGIISISVTLSTGFFAGEKEIDSIKQKAAYLANQYVYWLDKTNRAKMISKARQSRKFIESEIERTQADLDSAFNQLVQFQKQNKSIYLEKQTESALEGATIIRDKLYQAQLELGMKQNDFAESSRIISELKSQITQLQQLYSELNVPGSSSSDAEFFVPFARLPEVARDMAKLLRQVKVLEQVVLFLNQQYYQDRVQEAKDTPTTQVLDEAVPAILRTSPKRALWMILTFFISTLASVLFIAFKYGRTEGPTTPTEEQETQTETSHMD